MFKKIVFLLLFLFGSLLFSDKLAGQDPVQPVPLSLIDDSKPTFVIVHGAWGGSWAFREVESLLRQKGYDVIRPSLTGLGERYHLADDNVNLTTHLNDVINAILFEELEDIVLVGHSYGGMVITGVADRIPERIQSMIYIDAFVPMNGESVESIQGERFEGMMNMEEDGFIIPSRVQANQPPPKDVPHPIKTLTEPLELNNEARSEISTTYIQAVEEGTYPEGDDFAVHANRAKEQGWPVLIINSDHNPQWSAPHELADMLHQNW